MDDFKKYTQFFRCMGCQKALEMNEVLAREQTSCSCGGRRFFPTRLTVLEVITYLATHPRVLGETLKEKIWRQK